ncbi:BrnT family toxin [Methylobacterium sp. Leaf466]|uniref:BrnT family toxin n=1 Tax=Methylobacterium sp. Leaf466 TaxID=1736386 RepID=UPI0009E76E10|nr:BrnT family toxin [Methylobacterium sp. Leaf466]
MITVDPSKRDRTLIERGLDFRAAEPVFAGPVYEFEDLRAAYGDARIVTVGRLAGRMVVVGWTSRGESRPVFSMRKAYACRPPDRRRACSRWPR